MLEAESLWIDACGSWHHDRGDLFPVELKDGRVSGPTLREDACVALAGDHLDRGERLRPVLGIESREERQALRVEREPWPRFGVAEDPVNRDPDYQGFHGAASFRLPSGRCVYGSRMFWTEEGFFGGALHGRRPQVRYESGGGMNLKEGYSSLVTSSRPRSTGPLGGSLARGRNGELYTMQTLGGAWTPITAQEVWSHARQRRYPKAWNGVEPRDDMHVVWWTGPTVIECGDCRTEIVGVMAYNAGREYGIVLDTTRRSANPSSQRPKPGMKCWLDGHIGGRPGRTSVNFSCPGCHRKYLRRNFRRLGKDLFDTRPERYLLR